MGSLDSAQLVAHSEVFFKLISRRLPVPLWGIIVLYRSRLHKLSYPPESTVLPSGVHHRGTRAARVLRRHRGLVLRPRGRDRHEPHSPGND